MTGTSCTVVAWALSWLICISRVSADSNKQIPQGPTTTLLEQRDGTLLQSMHCFNKTTGAWLDNADWKPSCMFVVGLVYHYSLNSVAQRVHGVVLVAHAAAMLQHQMDCSMQATSTNVQHIENFAGPEGSLLSHACEALNNHLDFTFAVPARCPLHIKMYFADPTGIARKLQAYVDGEKVSPEIDIGALGSSGGTSDVNAQSAETGLLELALIPSQGSGPALISGIQVYATQECPKEVTKVFESTGAQCIEQQNWR